VVFIIISAQTPLIIDGAKLVEVAQAFAIWVRMDRAISLDVENIPAKKKRLAANDGVIRQFFSRTIR
jgi:hypothetical protein